MLINNIFNLQIYDQLIYKNGGPLRYVLTYKMSQDHLELFFCAVRSAGGFNNNPTARQFCSIYRKLLVRHEVRH